MQTRERVTFFIRVNPLGVNEYINKLHTFWLGDNTQSSREIRTGSVYNGYIFIENEYANVVCLAHNTSHITSAYLRAATWHHQSIFVPHVSIK